MSALSDDLARAIAAISSAQPDIEVAGFAEIDSTNSEARRRINASAAAPFIILADFQTAGRGQQGRRWEGAVGKSFLGTIAWRGAADSLWPMRVGLAVAEALELSANCAIEWKWPNDLLLNGGKLAGILVEAASGWLIAGVGVNISQTREELPPRDPAVPRATSLANELGAQAPARDAAIVAIAGSLISSVENPLPPPLLIGAIRKRWNGAGRVCRVRTPAGYIEAVVEHIGEDGALIVRAGTELIAINSAGMVEWGPSSA